MSVRPTNGCRRAHRAISSVELFAYPAFTRQAAIGSLRLTCRVVRQKHGMLTASPTELQRRHSPRCALKLETPARGAREMRCRKDGTPYFCLCTIYLRGKSGTLPRRST